MKQKHRDFFENRFSRRFARGVVLFEESSLCFGVIVLSGLLIINFVSRELHKAIYFSEEISMFLVIWVTFVGTSYAVRRARHIRMGAIFDALPQKIKQVVMYLIAVVSTVVMFFMTYLSIKYLLHALRMGQVSPALRLPSWIFYIIIPVGFFMAGVQYLRTITKNIREKEVWLSPEQKSEYEEEG
ncbi:MAG: TRAP transporter small permease [Spirochaetota bacterium]